MSNPEGARPSARDINDTIRYTCWTVFRRTGIAPGTGAAAELGEARSALGAADTTIRGVYDVSGLRADADLMVWMHAPTAEAIQAGLRDLRRTGVGRSMTMTWSGMALHRPAEFNKGHVPAFMAGHEPRGWVCVYPFVRSFEWYLLPDDERRGMLVEHGMMGRDYGGILSNTVAAFALGDYEWILALESDELHEIVDMMRHLRGSRARRHVREEVPFFTGRLVDDQAAVELLA
ncbi:MAG: hydrogen peroxide-dependent heme synthase [Candidatus Nanopelagicales bacterium]